MVDEKMVAFRSLMTVLRVSLLCAGFVGFLALPAGAEEAVEPPAGWKWDRPVAEHTKQRDGATELRTEVGRIWAGEGNRNRLLTTEPVQASDTVTAEIELVDAVGKWEQCGLLLHQHDDAFVKLVVEHIDGKHYIVMAWERPDGRKVLAQTEIPQASAQLKLEVDDRTVTGYWRLEKSASWARAAESDLPGDGEHRFGVFTQDGDPDRPRSALVRDLRWKQSS